MAFDDPFGPGGRFDDFFRRQREMDDLMRRTPGPAYDLHRRMNEPQKPFDALKAANAGVFADSAVSRAIEAAKSHSDATAVSRIHDRIASLASPAWMSAIQQGAAGVDRFDQGILQTQRLLAASTVPDVVKLSRVLMENHATIARLATATDWVDKALKLTAGLGTSMPAVGFAVERARALQDAVSVAASAGVVAAATHVLEAQWLVAAMEAADTPERSMAEFVAFVAAMSAIFETFRENTVAELRKMGASGLIQLLVALITLFLWVKPADMTDEEQAAFSDVRAQVEVRNGRIDELAQASRKQEDAYVARMRRGALKRGAIFRSRPEGRAPALLRGEAGMSVAIAERRGRWMRVVFRDPLTDQLAEGWVHVPAVETLDDYRTAAPSG